MRARRLLAVLGVLAVALAIALVAGHASRAPSPPHDAPSAARAFLSRYGEPDGRIVRRDQGGDTVSEGQAYGMLLAIVARDRPRFDRIWGWTRAHLQRPDGLLSWRWQGDRVVDAQPASDADLDAAQALVLAARRFGEPSLAGEARRIGAAVAANETTASGVLVAGPWARAAGAVNPSYYSPLALHLIGQDRIAVATRPVVAALTANGASPPDWAAAGPPPRPTGAPSGDGPMPAYDYDAARVPVRMAASCDPRDRALAASMTGLANAAPSHHPVFTVAIAAQARAAGHRRRAARLLDQAASADARNPSYYGAAWVALGRALLQTDVLSACPGPR
jgi:endoglucanase